MRSAIAAFAFFIVAIAPSLLAEAQEVKPVHALTLLDIPKYGPDWQYPDYVNPDAPKGGIIRYGVIGTAFDTFNPLTIKGTPAAGSTAMLESLTDSTEDDTETEYGLIAESVEVAPDKSWVIFNLRPEARWHDGQPITAEDMVFSFNILKEKGLPLFRLYYANVSKAEILNEHKVKFVFSIANNRELPQIMGQLYILPKHYWEKHDFEESGLEIPVGSGPYKITAFEPGRSVTLERVKDYWGANLPLRRGQNNFDTIRYDYYRDATVALEAFKAGAYDVRSEASAKNWATAYDIPQVKDGRIKLERIPDDTPQGMAAFIFNLRRPFFQDRKVREALNYGFDFEWTNKTLFYGQYNRTRSFFENSEMAATALPSPEELKILEKYRGQIPDEVFTQVYQPPKTDGSGNMRENLAKADQLLNEAGWKIVNGQRMKDGQPLKFEILLNDPAFERIVQPMVQNYSRLGINVTVRTVDAAQYQNRVQDFDFDMIVGGYAETNSPGNEQRSFWGSAAAGQQGSNNYAGIKNPAIDSIIEELVQAPNRKTLITYCKALDRILQWNYYVIPRWNLPATRLAYWDKFGRPPVIPKYGVGLGSWWINPAKASTIKQESTPAAQPTTPSQPEKPTATADRGTSPIPYVLGGILLFGIAFWLGKKVGRK